MLAILVDQFITEKTNKFEWTLDGIRIEKIILTPIWTKNFFWRFQFYQMLDIVSSCNFVQYQGKLMMHLKQIAKTLILDPIWSLRNFFYGFCLY